MTLSAALLDLFVRAAAEASTLHRRNWGIPEVMLAALAAPQRLADVWDGLLKSDEHRVELLRHFRQAATAVAAQEAVVEPDPSDLTGTSGVDEEEDEDQEARLEALTALGELAPPPDETMLSLLASWLQQKGEEELDEDQLLHLILVNWAQLYPVSLESLGIKLAREGSGAADFLRAFFGPDQDLNRRFGQEPMQGLLPYPEYCRSAMEVLVRRYRQNLLIYGQPGAGKSMVLRRLVEETVAGRVPRIFAGKHFFEFSRELFLKDLQNQQDLQNRFDTLRIFLENHPEIILVIDGLQHWFANNNAVMQDVLQRLIGLFKYKKLHFVVLADVDFYNRVYKANPLFDELLAPLYVKPLSKGDVLLILEQIKGRFEEDYGVPLTREMLERVVAMADVHIRSSQFPKKALILLDVALSIVALEGSANPPDWDMVVRQALGRLTGDDSADFPDLKERLNRLEERLKERIIGQDAAIADVCRTIRFTQSDLEQNPERPDGVFLFAGPAGVGKQLFATELSHILYSRDPLLLDMTEFQEAESLQLIIGRYTAGEGGYPQTTVLDRLRAEPRRVLLLRNLEFAAGEVLHYFLKGFEEGYLRDASGQQLAVSNTTVVMLSDLLGYEHKGNMGFGHQQNQNLSVEELKEYFMHELLRSIDKLVVFQPLSEANLQRILQERIMPAFQSKVASLGHELVLGTDVAEWVARQGGKFDLSARNVDRKFEELVAERVNEEILASRGTLLKIEVHMEQNRVELVSSPILKS